MKYPISLIAAAFFLLTLNTPAQKAFDCKKLLKQEVAPEESVKNFTEHADCFGFD